MRTRLYIDGKWVEGDVFFKKINPWNEAVFGEVVQSDVYVVNKAVDAALNALPLWRNTTLERRSEILIRAASLLRKKYSQEGKSTSLKRLIMEEVGKPFIEAEIEIGETADVLEFFAREGLRVLQPRYIPIDKDIWPTKNNLLLFEPVGVIGVIKPWNYPLELPIWAIAPALMAGNTVVFKPSEYSSFVGMEIVKIFEEAGLPPGVLNLITGDGSVGRILVKHPKVDMIAFTGSLRTGEEIAVECARQLKRYVLELSGNDPAIVDKEANIELTANGLVWGAFCNAGQVCVGIKRAFVHKDIAKDIISLTVEKTRDLRLGIDVGPLVSEKQLSKIENMIADALQKGAKILIGGKRADRKGYFYYPTILVNVTEEMMLMKEECFGPLLPIVVVDDIDKAINMANQTDYGLGSSIWTTNKAIAHYLAKRLESGMVWINDVNIAFPQSPWVGRKKSAVGVELSEWGLFEFVNMKHISEDFSNEKRRAWWYPYPKADRAK